MTLKLPRAPVQWSNDYQSRHNQAAEIADLRNRKIGTNVELAQKEKLVVRSPSGKRFSVTLGDDGTVLATPLDGSIAAGFTVGTLPVGLHKGARAFVTDATAPTFLGALTGGGTVKCPVFYNGTIWVAG